MPERIPQSVTKKVVFRAILSTDHVTPATGKTVAITISKNGAAFGNPNAGATNATEISSGFYKFDLDGTDTGTQGPLAWRGAVSGIDDVGDVYTVVSATDQGFPSFSTTLAAAVISRMTEVGLTQSAGGSPGDLEFTQDALRYASSRTQVDAGLAAILSRLPTALVGGRIDASVGAMQNTTLTSAAIATDAIGASKLASDAVAEIAAGVLARMTEAGLTQAAGGSPGDLEFTQDALRHAATQGQLDAAITAVLARLPAALIGGRMDATVGAMQANVVTAAALAADAGTELGAAMWVAAQALGLIQPAGGSPSEYEFTQDALRYAAARVQLDNATAAILARLPAALVGGRMDSSTGAMQANVLTAAALAADASTEISASILTALRDVGVLELAAGSPGDYRFTTDALVNAPTSIGGGGSGLDAAGTRAALGMAAANLDAQLATIAGYVDTEVLAIKSTTDALFSLLEPATGSPSEYRLTADALQRSTTVLGLAAGDMDAQFAQVIGAMPSSAALADAVLDEALAGHMIAGSAGRALYDADKRGARVTLRGAVGAAPAPSTTQFAPSSLDATCSSVDQFLGRVLVFDKDTTTTALQGQAAVITANTADVLPLLTFDALTSAPVAGDTFSIV